MRATDAITHACVMTIWSWFNANVENGIKQDPPSKNSIKNSKPVIQLFLILFFYHF